MIAVGIILALGFLLLYRALRRIAANQVAQAKQASNIHDVQIAALNAIRKAVERQS